MEAKTPEEFFTKILPYRFKPEKAKGINVTTQVNLIGTNGGDWTVEIKDQRLTVTKGNHPTPKLTVGMTSADFLDLVNDKISTQKAFFTGKIKFNGDVALALKLKDAGFL
jgi:putative sterol carrier protein